MEFKENTGMVMRKYQHLNGFQKEKILPTPGSAVLHVNSLFSLSFHENDSINFVDKGEKMYTLKGNNNKEKSVILYVFNDYLLYNAEEFTLKGH